MGGSRMAGAACGKALAAAIASLYSYDDSTCRTANSALPNLPPGYELRFVGPANYAFAPNYKRISQNSNFEANLYCDVLANVLILAFRGSVSPTSINQNTIEDWYFTNVLQQLGDRPVQYQAAEDVAYYIEKDWDSGRFDGKCGSGPPKFMLTGHSKGGGQAQYAAVNNRLEATVFNSVPANSGVYNDWTVSRYLP